MTVQVRSPRLRSRLKARVLRMARVLGYLLPDTLAGGLSNWSPQLVPLSSGTERDVEIAWVAAAVTRCVGFWLDVGYAHAEPRYWDAIQPAGWRRHFRYGHGLDLIESDRPDPLPIHVVGDVLEYDFARLPRFDLITCVSTLEHIGCDNTRYAPAAHRRPKPFALQQRAFARLLSALTRRGRLLLTLPYGRFEDHGWFLQYDCGMVEALGGTARRAGFRLVRGHYYRYTPEGWRRVPAGTLSALHYQPDAWRASAVALLEFAR